MSKQTALEVLVFGKAGFVGSLVFRTPKVTIGRAADAMVRLDDPQVSLHHATLTLDGGLFRIKDNGSRTGTRVNGAPILPRQPLEPTDELTIGPFRLRVTMCDPEDEEDEPTHANDEATMRLASLVTDISKPTAEAFFPPGANGRNGTSVRGEPSPRVAREPRWSEPPPRVPLESELGDSGNEPTLVRSSEAPPPYGAPSARAPTREARGPAPLNPLSQRVPARDLFEPPPKPAPLPKSSTPPKPTTPSNEATRPKASKAVSERPAPLPAHDTREIAPAEFAFAFPDTEPRREHDDDDEEDDINFVPSFDLLDELTAASVDEGAARGRPLLLEVVHARNGRIRSIHHPRVPGPLRAAGLKDVFGAVEQDGTVAILPDACRGLTVTEGRREISPASRVPKNSNKMPFVAGMRAKVDLPGNDQVLIHWVGKANAVDVPPVTFRPTREGMTSGGASLAVHVAGALLLGILVFGEGERLDSDINAGRFATISTKELELEPPPPPPPPQEAPTVDNAPTIELPANTHDVTPKKNAKVAVKGNVHASSSDAPPSNTPTASTQKILASLGGATSSVSAISVTNLDALPSAAGGDFKVSGALGKAPGDTLHVAAAGGGKDVDTKTASELGANKMGRVQGVTGGGTVRGKVNGIPQSVRGEGHLDRGEIQKVVNAHLFQIQGCYERQLARDPSLSGKISFEWDVGLTGGVSNVRVGRSTIHSVEVTTCIQSAIQGWHFPTPQGGTVTVTYPFAFSALGG